MYINCNVLALLAAAAPDKAPFMADECLKAIPAIEGIDYTAKEYLNFVDHIQNAVERLNGESKSKHSVLIIQLEDKLCNSDIHFCYIIILMNKSLFIKFFNLLLNLRTRCIFIFVIGSEGIWNPHSVELALWTHYVASELKPELLSSIPEAPKKPISEQTKTDAHINGNVNQTKVII